MINAQVLVDFKIWKIIIKNPEKQVKYLLNKFPNTYKFSKKKVYFSVLLTNNTKIRLLNKKFRKINKPTDILSFPFFEKKNLKKNMKNRKIYLGDIIISYEEFYKINKKNLKDGFIKILIHGFLHLLNYDHKSNKDYKIMRNIEDKIFQKVKG